MARSARQEHGIQGGRPPDPGGQVLGDKGLQGVREIPHHLTPVPAARPRASAPSVRPHGTAAVGVPAPVPPQEVLSMEQH